MLVLFSHTLIDLLKLYFTKLGKIDEKYLFIGDQLLHLLAIYAINQLAAVDIGFKNPELVKWILLTVLVTKPANILFRIFFGKYQTKQADDTVPGAGALIGNLERILSVIFISLNQLSAVGLIYTAKSIARFKEIESNRRFAEYYLIGTLYSILYAMIAYYLVFYFI